MDDEKFGTIPNLVMDLRLVEIVSRSRYVDDVSYRIRN